MKIHGNPGDAILALTGGAAPVSWLLFTLLTRNHFALDSFSLWHMSLCLGLSLGACVCSLLWKPRGRFWSWGRVIGWGLLALGTAAWLMTLTTWSSGWRTLVGDGRLPEPVYHRLLWCAWGGLVTGLAGLLPGVISGLKPNGEL